MATVILDTGVPDAQNLQVGQAQGTDTLTPIERQIYPSANSDNPLVSVQPGMMVVVTAYGETDGPDTQTLAEVYKVLLAEPVDTTSVSSCSFAPVEVQTKIIGEAKLCGLALLECYPMQVIDVPGVYSIRALHSDLTITAVAHPRHKV